MLDPQHFTVIAGQPVVDLINERQRKLMESGVALPRAQELVFSEGFIGVNIVPTLYGWSIRYDTGLMNFEILSGSMSKTQAYDYARSWVNDNQNKRYAFIRKIDENRDELEPYKRG